MQPDDAIERALRGDATREELEAIAAWRRQSPENERHYRRVERLIRGAASMRPELRSATPPTATELLARSRPVPVRVQTARAARRWWIGAIAAAALLAAAALGHVTAVGVNEAAGATEIVTGPSELATVQLGDGSVVRLGPSTRLGFGEAARDVTLDGRAYFVVAHAPRHPFLVRTSMGVARVLGTRFELATSGQDLELTVVEGRVALDALDNSVEVEGGERTRVAGRMASAPQRVAEADSTLEWVGTFLAFQSTPLADAMRDVERIYGLRVTITDSVLARQTVTATFTSRGAEEVIAVLCSVVSARCTASGDTIRVSR